MRGTALLVPWTNSSHTYRRRTYESYKSQAPFQHQKWIFLVRGTTLFRVWNRQFEASPCKQGTKAHHADHPAHLIWQTCIWRQRTRYVLVRLTCWRVEQWWCWFDRKKVSPREVGRPHLVSDEEADCVDRPNHLLQLNFSFQRMAQMVDQSLQTEYSAELGTPTPGQSSHPSSFRHLPSVSEW